MSQSLSTYRINKVADEHGIAHGTAMLIWESSETLDDFLVSIEDFAAGKGFTIID